MSKKEESPSLTGYYSMEKFIKELKKISGLPETEDNNYNVLQSTPIQASTEINNMYLSPYSKNQADSISDKELNKDNLYIPSNNLSNIELYDNEKIKSQMTKLRKENAELKFSLNNINKKFENELKEIKKRKEIKNSQLKKAKEILKKNAALIESFGGKISDYEKIINEYKEKQNSEQENSTENGDNQYMALFEDNKQLKQEIIDKDNMINDFKSELITKNEIFEEINTMKKEMEDYLKTMDN